ncbi:hypothetical protein LINGRAHAP2_LOCUS16547 [Linum grandiflorum]
MILCGRSLSLVSTVSSFGLFFDVDLLPICRRFRGGSVWILVVCCVTQGRCHRPPLHGLLSLTAASSVLLRPRMQMWVIGGGRSCQTASTYVGSAVVD